MYQQPPYHPQPTSAPSRYTSPPMPGVQDPYRAAPIAMQARSPYTSANSALSPPSSSSSGFSPMPASSSRHHLPPNAQYASRSGGPRYTSSPAPGYAPVGMGMNMGMGAGYGANPPLPIPPQQTPQQKYKGTLAPGTIIKVGDAQVRIERYLSEGGYAHVYLTTSDRPVYPPSVGGGGGGTASKGRWGEKGYSQHCLKRIAFEDEKVWVDVRQEIEVMKALPPNPHLTQYLASAHSRLPNGGYEVFILMEFCSGGGIIDLLNKRLRDRLKEIEILNIFTDVCEAVAAMHHLKQPLLHRDLKIENVLSAPTGQSASPQRPTPLIFKLCDFGSTTFPSSHPPQNKVEAEALALNLNKHTTLQYRSPEMVEPMLGWAVGLPSDVWALGVLLYKLCYYTTPFEEHGTLAIVNAKYSFPQYPVYSPKIQHLIASMLVDHPARRPSVFEILNVAHEMSGTRPEIDYPLPSRSFPPSSSQPSKPKSTSTNLLDFTSPSPTPSSAPAQPDITSTVQPQRRGRPTREPSNRPMSSFTPPMSSTSTPSLQPMSQPPVVSAEPKASKPKMRVTGEQEVQKAKTEKQPSIDAFGMPAMAAPGKEASTGSSGFGDSFAASQPKGVAGISQRFGGGAPARSGTADSGFSDSFTAPKPASQPVRKPSHRVASPESTLSSSRSNPTVTTEAAAGDLSFETRFPSIDMLDSADGATPQPAKSASNLISPITSPPISKPPLQPRASMMGHLTGDMAPKHQPLAVRAEGGPQPRSTQVTGTAFKVSDETPPAGSRPVKGDYFDGPRSGQGSAGRKAESPVDLMTGDAYSSMTATSRQNSMAVPTVSEPNGGAAAPGPDESRSLLSSGADDADSSDEEDVRPESASGTGMGPSTSIPSGRQAGFPSSSSMAFNGSLGRTNSSGLPPSSSSGPSRAGPGITAPKPVLRRLSTDRVRPQSMFIPSPSSSGFKPLVSPSSAGLPNSASAGAGRPSHIRKGSITDMVTKYESLQSPSSAKASVSPERKPRVEPAGARDGAIKGEEKVPNGLGRKPSVASKPQTLRKPSANGGIARLSTSPEQEKQGGVSPVSSIPSTTKPTNLSSEPTKPKSSPSISDKPILAPKPSRHGDMPAIAGYSKSSSGRSFPISRASPAVSASANQPRTTTPLRETQNVTPTQAQGQGQGKMGSSAGKGNGEGSPEKQQSVGSLIARWNQTK